MLPDVGCCQLTGQASAGQDVVNACPVVGLSGVQESGPAGVRPLPLGMEVAVSVQENCGLSGARERRERKSSHCKVTNPIA